ncbi:MAG: SAM-dependent chlorinase/fluorinase [Bacteroidales bacterium]|jgi:S-adenosylmethionine hydrolase|nr:SAM-dependent chlorinase/fluorinase [Bacteroidales bacterium]
MPIITLTTDWNNEDFYIGAVKGSIYSQCNQIQMVDITHQIKPFNIFQTAFILKNSYHFFPRGSVHIIGVKTEILPDQPVLVAKCNEHYFVGTDNGIFSLLFKEEEKPEFYLLDDYTPSSFPVLDIFTKVACKIIQGELLTSFCTQTETINRRVPLRATIEDNVISGSIVYIDSFQNAITNVSKDLFERVIKGKPFKIYVQSNHYMISKINRSYHETSAGEILALFNSLNLLEIAINGGNAAELLNLTINSSIRIKF